MTQFLFCVFYFDGLCLISCLNLLIFTGLAGQIVSPWVTWWQGYEQWKQRRYHEFGSATSHNYQNSMAFNPGNSRNRNSLHNNDCLVSMNTTKMCMIAKEFQSYYIHIWIMIIDLSHETYESTSSKLMGSSAHWVHFALGSGLRWTSCLYADVDQPCTTKDAGTTNRWLMNWDPREVQGLLLMECIKVYRCKCRPDFLFWNFWRGAKPQDSGDILVAVKEWLYTVEKTFCCPTGEWRSNNNYNTNNKNNNKNKNKNNNNNNNNKSQVSPFLRSSEPFGDVYKHIHI